jgi:hypothetical protein
MPHYENIREEGVYDPVGTVRVCQQFGAIAVYIKVDEDAWITSYVDPLRCKYLAPERTVGDAVATTGPVVFTPKVIGA